MAQLHYTAEVKSGLLLELPIEAEELHLKPGDKIEVQLDLSDARDSAADPDPTIALLEPWIAQAPTDLEGICEAEEDQQLAVGGLSKMFA